MNYASRRIWIIGASAGIGAALARALAGQGAQLILSARDSNALETLAAECGGAQARPLDLAQPETLGAVVAQLAHEAPLDAIICTAALYDPGRVADIDPARADAMVRVNILGMLEVARLYPPLLRDGGQLVLFGSVAGYIGLPGGSHIRQPRRRSTTLPKRLRSNSLRVWTCGWSVQASSRPDSPPETHSPCPQSLPPNRRQRRCCAGCNGGDLKSISHAASPLR